MKQKPTLKQRFLYIFDNIMASGTPAMVGMLGLTTLILILIASLVLWLAEITQDGGEPLSFGEAFWESMMRSLDPGTMGGDTGSAFRIIMLVVTLGGVFIVSGLIGVLSSGVEQRLEELRKGRSVVLENGHTIILGWSPQVFTIISELVEANRNQEKPCITILADIDKVEMEDEIRARIPNSGNTRIICRSGSPMDPAELNIASPETARSIIVLPPENSDPDPFVIKTVLAITHKKDRGAGSYNIVTQLEKEQNVSVVKMIGENDRITPLWTGDLIARVTAQTSRQSGLSMVYTELLNFTGSEIYFANAEGLEGKTYGETLGMYETSCIIGLYCADGSVRLNPAMSRAIQAGDQLIVLSEDDDTIHASGIVPSIDQAAIRTQHERTILLPEKALILGWNEAATTIIHQLDSYIQPGSIISVVAAKTLQADIQSIDGLTNQTLNFIPGDTTSRELLDRIKIRDYDHVIVLSDTTLAPQEADSRTLVTLLHLRHIAETEQTPFSIVSEMLDIRNRELAEVTNVDDFIVSDHFISLMLAQLSENSHLANVFADLFAPEGTEIYFKSITDYISTDRPVNFYTVTEAARQRGETAIGYRLLSEARNSSRFYGVHTNPKKSELVQFSLADKVIVLAES